LKKNKADNIQREFIEKSKSESDAQIQAKLHSKIGDLENRLVETQKESQKAQEELGEKLEIITKKLADTQEESQKAQEELKKELSEKLEQIIALMSADRS